MEIGSFIEMQFLSGKEYYSDDYNIARLNSGRTAIWHAFRLTGCKAIWIPYYQCDSVREFLYQKNISVKFYYIDTDFNPVNLIVEQDEAVLFVNYFGIMSWNRMYSLTSKYKNVIIDNSQAFFAKPFDNCLNVYSARKFIGVPDGAYVIGKGADQFIDEYEQGYSSDTSQFLLERIEYGCEGKTYQSRMINENRIGSEGIKKMSKLTRTILDSINYQKIINRRKENFAYAAFLYKGINRLEVEKYYDDTCVPMVYPLVIENKNLISLLLKHKHFQGHWWSYLLNELEHDRFEYWLSKYIIPITIDQRYGNKEIEYVNQLINNFLNKRK